MTNSQNSSRSRSLLRAYLDLYEGNRWVGLFFFPMTLIAAVVGAAQWASQFGVVVAVGATILAAVAWGGASLLVQRETRKVLRAAAGRPLTTLYRQATPRRRVVVVVTLAGVAALAVFSAWLGLTQG